MSKTAYIEANLPKRQVVECATLWCVAKHHLRRKVWSARLAPPTNSRM